MKFTQFCPVSKVKHKEAFCSACVPPVVEQAPQPTVEASAVEPEEPATRVEGKANARQKAKE